MGRKALGITKKMSLTLPEWAWEEIAHQQRTVTVIAARPDGQLIIDQQPGRTLSEMIRGYVLAALPEPPDSREASETKPSHASRE